MEINRFAVVLPGAAAVCLVGLLISGWHGSSNLPDTHDLSVRPYDNAGGSYPNISPSTRALVEHLPPSLRGTQVDGALRVDKDGNLVIDDGVRRCFDYFMAATGEESIPAIRNRVRAYIRLHLPVSAASQAEQLLENYLALNAAQSELQSADGSIPGNTLDAHSLREQLLFIQGLRRQYLSAEVIDAFYTDDDALDQLALRRMEIMDDVTLSESLKAAALMDAERALPSHLQQINSDLIKHQQMNELTAELREHGGSDADVYQLRERFYGAEAADRLAQLDDVRRQWLARTSQWLEMRDRLMAKEGLDENSRSLEIDRSRRELFEAEELRRVQAIEKVHDTRTPF